MLVLLLRRTGNSEGLHVPAAEGQHFVQAVLTEKPELGVVTIKYLMDCGTFLKRIGND